MKQKIITSVQAYNLSLDTLKLFEQKWRSYAQRDTKLLSVFDEKTE